MSVARYVLVVLLLAMAVGQLSDVAGFVDIVATYEVGGRAVAWVLAVGLIVGELTAGAGLVVRGRPARRQHAAVAAVVVALVWSVLAVEAFARGLVLANCGCFGVHLGQPLRWWILLEDAELVVLALWVRHATLRRPVEASTPARPVGGR